MSELNNPQDIKADSSCINLQMLRTSHRVLKVYDDAYRPFGIKATQLPVLALIERQNEMTTKEIADQTETERSVLSRKLAVMEKNSWIISSKNPFTREKVFQLTERGKRLLTDIKPTRTAVQERLLAQLSDSERELLLNLCDKFHGL